MRAAAEVLFAGLLLAAAGAARAQQAEQELATVLWSSPPEGAEVAAGLTILQESGMGPAVVVENAGDQGLEARLLVLRAPGVTRARYALLGQVRYEGVEGDGYLEMWSVFPNGGRYFTRTVDTAGPMERLRGSSPWRDFALPFTSREGYLPRELVVNAVLPGKGRVWVGPVRLVQYIGPTGWWSGGVAGLVFGVLGSLLGLAGGLMGLLASRGRARRLAMGLARGMLVLGPLALAGGIAAAALGQPYEVWYPLAISGALCAGLGLYMPRLLRRRYEQAELRRMQALDAGR